MIIMFKIIFFIISIQIITKYPIEAAIAQNHSRFQTDNNAELVSGTRLILAQSSNGKNDYLIKTLLIVGLASVVGIVGWRLSRAGQSVSLSNMPGRISSRTVIDRVSPKLRRKLLRLINDPKTANRLLMGIQKDNPHRSPDWLAEKVIYDLQRGR